MAGSRSLKRSSGPLYVHEWHELPLLRKDKMDCTFSLISKLTSNIICLFSLFPLRQLCEASISSCQRHHVDYNAVATALNLDGHQIFNLGPFKFDNKRTKLQRNFKKKFLLEPNILHSKTLYEVTFNNFTSHQ